MPSSSVIHEYIENVELGPYWEEHKETLDILSKKDMPSKSSMFYKEVIANKNEETNHLLLKYGIINFSNNRKNFLRINAEMTPDFLIKSEEIIFSDGLEQAKRTLVSDQNDIHKDHKDWLKKMYQKYSYKTSEK